MRFFIVKKIFFFFYLLAFGFTNDSVGADEIAETQSRAEVIRVYSQIMPATRFIGKMYLNEDRGECYTFAPRWHDWFDNSWFDVIKDQANQSLEEWFEDGSATIGLMRLKEGEPFQYWVGMFLPTETDVPEGFAYVDFPESRLGIASMSIS
jgi:hypothetical protein